MTNANIHLKNEKFLLLENFYYLSYLDEYGNSIKVYDYKYFCFNDKFVNFVSKNKVLSIHSDSINFINFSDI